jgi:hypothetical protein
MKALLALIILTVSVTSFAQSRNTRRIPLNDGRSTVLITIDDRQDLNLRVRLLEEAVRDLQAQVYDLQDQPRRVSTIHVCALKTSWNGTLIGKASTKLEADADVRNKCNKAGLFFCDSAPVTCEVQEIEL